MAMQCCHQMLMPFSWSQNQEIAPTMQGVCSTGKITSVDIVPPRQWCIGSIISVEKVVGETWEE
eukprot:8689480-Ditylum_brightwellii.AAC.1